MVSWSRGRVASTFQARLRLSSRLRFSGSSAGGAGNAAVVQQVINAAYHAFGTGLHAALYLSAGLVLAAGILTAITLRSSARPDAPTSDPAEPG